MARMRVRDLENVVIASLSAVDHPEIVAVRPTTQEPDDARHTRVRVEFTSGATAFVMVREVTGPAIPKHQPFQLPREAM